MSFLSLFALFGLGLASLPIIFHLKRQKIKEKQTISSLMFLQPTVVPQKQSRKMEQWLLLLLRLLALICLVLAFSRPVWLGDLIVEQGLQRDMVTWVVDTSASMQRPEVQKKLAELLEQESKTIQANDQFELITFSHKPQVSISYEQWENTDQTSRLKLLQEQINAIEPTQSSSKMNDAVLFSEQRQAQTWTQLDDFQKLAQRKVIIFSDLTKNQSLDRLEAIKDKQDIEITFHNLNIVDSNNARPYFASFESTGQAPKLGIDYIHGSQEQNFKLELFQQDKVQFSTEVTISPNRKKEISWPASVDYDSNKAYQLKLTGDNEAFDNLANFIASQQDQLHVLYYENSTFKNTEGSNRFFLEMGLKSDPKLKVVFHENSNLLSEKNLPFVVIGTDLQNDELNKVMDMIKNGASALVLMNAKISSEFLSNLTGQSLSASSKQHVGGLGLKRIDTKSPLFKHFSDPRYRDFSALYFWKSYHIQGWNSQNTPYSLADFENDTPFLQQLPLGKGQLWIMSSNWSSHDSNLARSSKFLPFIFSLIEESLARRTYQANYRVSETFNSPFELSAESEVKVLSSSSTKSTIPLLETTQQSGVYKVAKDKQDYAYYVNLDLNESKTQSLDPNQLNYLNSFNAQGEVSEVKHEPQKREVNFLKQLEGEQKLWQSLLLAAFAFILLETLIAAWKSKLSREIAH